MIRYYNAVTDTYGNALVGATVAVRDLSGTLAVLYSDDGVTSKANPFTTSYTGAVDFFAADSDYVATITFKGVSFTLPIQLYDLSDIRDSAQHTVRYDIVQSLTTPQRQQARDNIDVYSKAEVDSASTGVVENTIVDGVTNKAPSQNAVFDALTLKLDTSAYTAASVLSRLITVDGSGSGVDADVLRATTPTAAGLAVLSGANASAQRTSLGVVIGTDVQAYDADLGALAANSSTGIISRTGAGTVSSRTITAPPAGISVSDGDGVSGNPTLTLANDLSAVEGLSGTGLAVRTATDTWTNRTITGTANELTVTNGDGVSGAPTLSIPAAVTFTGKTVTGGTFDGITIGSTSTVTTQAVDTNTTAPASTAFVLAQAASATPVMDGTAAVGTSTRFARADHVHASDTSRVSLSALAATTGAALIGWISAATGASAITLATFFGYQRLTPYMFGAATGTSTTGNDAKLQAWLNAAGAGYKLHLPAGLWNFTAAFTAVTGNNIDITGDGDAAVLQYTGATTNPGSLLIFGDNSNDYIGLNLRDFVLGSTTSQTAGGNFFLRVYRYTYCNTDLIINGDIANSGNIYYGAWFDDCNQVALHSSRIYCKKIGVRWTGRAGHQASEFHCNQAWIAGSTTACTGIHVAGNTGGFYTQNLTLQACDIGLQIDTAAVSLANFQIFLTGGTFDSCITAGVYVSDTYSSGSTSKFIKADAWFSSSSAGSGLVIAAFTGGSVTSTTGVFKNNSGSGIYTADTSIALTLGKGVIIDHNNVGVDAAGAITIESDCVPLSNTSANYGSNITIKSTRNGTQNNTQNPALQWHENLADSSGIVIANGANAALPNGTGVVTIANTTNGTVAQYLIGGAGAVKIAATSAVWLDPAAPLVSADQKVAWTGSAYAIYNNTGASVTYKVGLTNRVRDT